MKLNCTAIATGMDLPSFCYPLVVFAGKINTVCRGKNIIVTYWQEKYLEVLRKIVLEFTFSSGIF